MLEMLSQFRVLVLLLLTFGLTIGIVSGKRVGKFIAGMIFMPLLLMVAFTYIQKVRVTLDPAMSLLFTIAILFAVLIIVLRLLLGKQIWHGVVADFVYDLLKWLVLLPFRIVRRIFGRTTKGG